MQAQDMKHTALRVSGVLKMLSHRERLMALCHLIEGEMSAGELGEALDMKPPAMSQQLSILRREGAVTTRREAQTIKYSIADDDVRKIMHFLYETFCQPEGSESGPSEAGARP